MNAGTQNAFLYLTKNALINGDMDTFHFDRDPSYFDRDPSYFGRDTFYFDKTYL